MRACAEPARSTDATPPPAPPVAELIADRTLHVVPVVPCGPTHWNGGDAAIPNGTMLRTDPAWDSSRNDWIVAFYGADRRIVGAAYSLPFVVPEGAVVSIYRQQGM